MTTSKRPPVRRVVTGHDDSGRAIILFDDADAPNTFVSEVIPGFGASVAWFTPAGAVDHASDEDSAPAGRHFDFPLVGETIVRIADFPPDAVYPNNPGEAVFEEIRGQKEQQAANEHGAAKHFWFHRTESIDYAVVLEGEITLLVDDGEAVLRAGDVAVQRATAHAWSNRTDKPARMLFVLVGTDPIDPSTIASLRSAVNTRESA
ncbi:MULTISPECIES: cupin domain-containing protein [unclassified Microbacterium]|uniref:cupin domain-containing protein n=1 Tax=unclassified Microbacterium TaxID=2609290 RepID=UPI000EA90587|nr:MULTISPECIES: cupin domain-containing protein [unclassified Microbacterium]MBT2486523.1 cupin domain-containing protein [Microbacterium sp. ISL-108]RKN69216.1 cupin domain-containing protein [Microbacterium sp. CGR2]